MSVPNLAYVALALTDVARVADVFERVLGLSPVKHCAGDTTVPLFSVGKTSLALFAADDPFLGGDAVPGVHHIALAADDPIELTRSAGISIEDLGPSGLDGADRVALQTDETCGVRVHVTSAIAHASTGEMVERLDHLGIACSDNAAASGVFHDRFGFPVESTQTDIEVHVAMESFTSDKYGVVHHTRSPRTMAGLRVKFITIGDCELEFLQPFDPQPLSAPDHGSSPPGPGNTGGDKGVIGRYIARRGPGLHHLALKTPDIDAVLGMLADAGLDMIDTVGRPGSRRARIGFLHPRSLGGLLLHFVQRDDA